MNEIYNIRLVTDLYFTVQQLGHDKYGGLSRFRVGLGRTWVEVVVSHSGKISLSWPGNGEDVSYDPDVHGLMEQLLRLAHELGVQISKSLPHHRAWVHRGAYQYNQIHSIKGETSDTDMLESFMKVYIRYRELCGNIGAEEMDKFTARVFYTLGWEFSHREFPDYYVTPGFEEQGDR